MPRTPSYGGGTSNMTMSSEWSARTPLMSPVCTASAQFSINVRICSSSSATFRSILSRAPLAVRSGPHLCRGTPLRVDIDRGGELLALIDQVDHERHPRVEPVAVQLLDLRTRRKPAKMDAALAVVNQVDRLAHGISCLCQLCRIAQLSRDTRERSAADPQRHIRVGPDVPNPSRDG